MSEDQKRQLNQQLWNIANTLRGKMDADEFRDYILGFIFYKYLSEKIELYANGILKEDKIKYLDISEDSAKGQQYLEAIREESLEKLGYFLKPSELFSQVAKRGNGNGKNISNFIIEDIQKILINIQNSTMGTSSEEDFDHLFEDMDLNSTKLGKSAEQRNEVISKVLSHLDKIDFQLEQTEIDVLGDASGHRHCQFRSSFRCAASATTDGSSFPCFAVRFSKPTRSMRTPSSFLRTMHSSMISITSGSRFTVRCPSITTCVPLGSSASVRWILALLKKVTSSLNSIRIGCLLSARSPSKWKGVK